MKKKKVIKHKYSLGGIANTTGWNSITSTGPSATALNLGQGLKLGLGSIGGGVANTMASTLGNIINPSGNSSTVGNVLQGVGSIASVIPGVGGLIGAGVNAVGGLWNAAFGSKLNDEFIEQTENNIDTQSNYVSNATDNIQLLSDWMSHEDLSYVDQDDVGSDGWFSNKAKNKTRELNQKIEEANARAQLSLKNTGNNIQTSQLLTALANYKADGGPLFMQYTGTMSPFGNRFAEGGGIHIKKKNRGKFTEYCGGKVTSACIQRGLHSSNPTTRKRANFARNARKWKHAFGGDLFTHGADWNNGVTYIGNGGTHEENPFEGVQMGIAPDGQPNLVEEGEVIFNDYVFSNRLKPSEEMKKANRYRGNTFADIAKNLQKESEERPNDPISKRGLEDSMTKLQFNQELIRQSGNSDKGKKQYSHGGKMGILFDGEGDGPNYLSYLRYAPVVGAAIGVGQNLFSKPDYSGANAILEAANDIGNYTPVSYKPIGNYLTYRPFDRDYYINKLNAQANSTRRAIMNSLSPSRNAALLAADYNAQGKLGDLFRQAEEYNLAQKQAVENFNRGTNMSNSEMGLKTAMANQEAELKAKSSRLSGIAQAMAMKDNIDSRRAASMSANLTNLFDSLGNIGIDAYNRADRDMIIKSGIFGTLSQKPQEWSDKRWEDYKKALTGTGYSKGGKLKKRRGGLTY